MQMTPDGTSGTAPAPYCRRLDVGVAGGLDQAGKLEDLDVGGAVGPGVMPADDYVAAGHSPSVARPQSPSPLPQHLAPRTAVMWSGHSCLSCPPQQPGSFKILAGHFRIADNPEVIAFWLGRNFQHRRWTGSAGDKTCIVSGRVR